MPAAPTGKAVSLAENLGRHLLEVHTLGDGHMVRPVCRRHRILGFQVNTDAGGAGFLPGGKVHLAGDSAGADVEFG